MVDKPMVWRKLSGKVRPVVHLHDEEKEEIEGIKRRRKKKKDIYYVLCPNVR